MIGGLCGFALRAPGTPVLRAVVGLAMRCPQSWRQCRALAVLLVQQVKMVRPLLEHCAPFLPIGVTIVGRTHCVR